MATGGPDLLAALSWALAQPLHHGYPRQLFLFTAAAAAGGTGRILQLVRRQASTARYSTAVGAWRFFLKNVYFFQHVALSRRCFSFGMGPRACRQLLTAVAKLSRGCAEFLSPAERLQPKVGPGTGQGMGEPRGGCQLLSPPQLIKSLKKAIEPAVSDITIDWYVPDSTEALLSPTEIAALYPGDRLVSYCTLYSIARFRDRRPAVRPGALQTSPAHFQPPAWPCHGAVCVTALMVGPSLRQGRDRARRGSAVPSQDEVLSPGGTRPPVPGERREPSRGSAGSGEVSLEVSAGGTEESERSEWGRAAGAAGVAQGQCPDGVRIYRAGTDLVSGGDIWKRIYQPSYIQEQYVLTHCSVSTDRSQGLLSRSSTSSESTGSRDVAPEGGSPAPDAASQQGQKSLSLCESSTKSAPLPSAPAPAGVKVRLIRPRRWGCSPRSWGLVVPGQQAGGWVQLRVLPGGSWRGFVPLEGQLGTK